jgi:hypothetical protein
MSTNHSQVVSIPAQIAHWAACLFGAGLVLLFAVFWIGQGPPPVSLGSTALVVMLIGFLIGWWNDLVGGLVSLAGIGGFYVWNYAEAGGFPGGWVFPMCFLPGALLLVAWSLRHLR